MVYWTSVLAVTCAWTWPLLVAFIVIWWLFYNPWLAFGRHSFDPHLGFTGPRLVHPSWRTPSSLWLWGINIQAYSHLKSQLKYHQLLKVSSKWKSFLPHSNSLETYPWFLWVTLSFHSLPHYPYLGLEFLNKRTYIWLISYPWRSQYFFTTSDEGYLWSDCHFCWFSS